MDDVLFKFENVSYSAGGREIISHIDWTVKKREHWAVIGPNGAGKSTLLKLIYGFLWPNTSGNIYRKGEVLTDLGELRKSIGWVSNDLLNRVSRREKAIDTVVSGKYAQFGLWYEPDTRAEEADHIKAAGIMEKLGISGFSQRLTHSLSQGEAQKVLLARALMSGPYLVMLDEALEGLDPGARESFLEMLEAYISSHSEPSFIYVTHHVDEIIGALKDILVLKGGMIVYSGDTLSGLSSSTVSELYGRPFKLIRCNGRYRMEAEGHG